MTTRSSYDVAVGLLARREQAQSELRRKLNQKGFGADDIAVTLEKLLALDLQSDARYAEMIVRTKTQAGYGTRYIRQYLGQKGIAEPVVNLAITSESAAAEDKASSLIALIIKRGDNLSEEKERARCVRYLARRGFDFDEIYAAIERVKNQQAEE